MDWLRNYNIYFRFGKSDHDELSILAPLYQCCTIRKSTLSRLLQFYSGPTSLGAAMKASLLADIASPILLDRHLDALDRRVAIILQHVSKCLSKVKLSFLNGVIVDDGF